MGFLTPKVPKSIPPPLPPLPPTPAEDSMSGTGIVSPEAASLISTSTQGLKRRASVRRTSLIGGA
jgi:hypothetical protein